MAAVICATWWVSSAAVKKCEIRLYRNGEAMDLNAVIGGPAGGVVSSDAVRPWMPAFAARSCAPWQRTSWTMPTPVCWRLTWNRVSRAAAAGLQAGDVVIEVNRRAVADLAAFNGAVADTDRLTVVTVLRDGQRLLLFIP